MEIAEFEVAGLYDPNAPDAPERLSLLTVLVDRGATLAEIRQADAAGRLPGFAFELALRTGRTTLTTAEAAARHGVDPELLGRLRIAFGFADPGEGTPAWTEQEVGEALGVLLIARDLFGEEAGLQLARVIGTSLARIAEALASSFRSNVGVASLARDPTGYDLAQLNMAAADSIPGFIDALGVLLRRHLVNAIRPMEISERVDDAVDVARPAGYETVNQAIGFADLVGFTALSHQLDLGELVLVTSRFEALAGDTVLESGGRVVKLIGDAMMFVAPDAAAACVIASEIVEAAGRDGLPSARAAFAAGELLARDGDYFGPVVNLASRIVALAEPDGVVAPEDLAGIPGFIFTPLGSKELKGFDTPIALAAVSRARHR